MLLETIEQGLTDPDARRPDLEVCAEQVVAEVARIEGYLANAPAVHGEMAQPLALFHESLESYYQGHLLAAQSLEELEPAHLTAARRCFARAEDALQQAREMVWQTWEYEM